MKNNKDKDKIESMTTNVTMVTIIFNNKDQNNHNEDNDTEQQKGEGCTEAELVPGFLLKYWGGINWASLICHKDSQVHNTCNTLCCT